MTTKKQADRCVTHHHGCHCREYRFEMMESALKAIRTWADYRIDGRIASTPDDIVRLCDRALGRDLCTEK